MISPLRSVAILALLATSVGIQGCIAFDSGRLPDIQHFPVRTTMKPSTRVLFDLRPLVNGTRVEDLAADHYQKYEQRLYAALAESDYFGEIGPTVPDPDITLVIRLEDDGEVNMITTLVSGLTLYLIPSSATDRFDLYAQIRSSDPELVWRVDLEETMTQWYQLFLFPASPFLHPDTVHQRLMDKLFRNLVFEMHEQGILDEIASIVLGQSEAPSKSAGRITEPGPLHAERYSDTARKAPIGDH